MKKSVAFLLHSEFVAAWSKFVGKGFEEALTHGWVVEVRRQHQRRVALRVRTKVEVGRNERKEALTHVTVAILATRNQAKCYKDCYCKCLSDSDNTGAKNEIAALEDALKTNSCPEFAQNCVVWKEGHLHVSSTPVSAHASKILMIMSCLFIFTLTR